MNTLKMNALTPRTDKAVQESNGQWSFAMRNLCIQMECELTEAQDKIEELVETGLTQMDKERSLKRELAEARKQRDTLAEALEKIEQYKPISENRFAIRSEFYWLAHKALAAVKGGNNE